jgi:hypothetical protein
VARPPITRRGFLNRASAAALASVGAAAAFGRRRADAHVKPSPCRVRCEPISKTGCACGGHLYRCSGCGTTYHACIDGHRFAWFCQRRSC